MKNRDVLLIACQDQKGLIYKISEVLYRHNLNITETQEFVDLRAGRFFTRIQFEGESDRQQIKQELQGLLPQQSFLQLRPLEARRVVVMASKEPHCLGDLLLRHATGELSAKILAVISQENACAELVGRFGIPFHEIPVKQAGKSLSREEHELLVEKSVADYAPDYLILARYMRIFTKDFVKKFPSRVLNIHHSFLPAFIGKDPYEQAYARGVKMIGATAHFVTEDLDEGPIITQSVLHVDHSADPAEMARRGQDVEKIVLARATELVLADRVIIDGRRTVVFE